ncbi:uncharacterized protein [Musca autumnalis]|uniref:uncharacterized protein n=1 Tax=Musca autumnalis TaxID=221902 RepID=UPI003CF395A2
MKILMIFVAGLLLSVQAVAATVPPSHGHEELPPVVVWLPKDNKVVEPTVEEFHKNIPNTVDVVMPTEVPEAMVPVSTVKVPIKPGLSIISPTLPTAIVDRVVIQRSANGDDEHRAGVKWGANNIHNEGHKGSHIQYNHRMKHRDAEKFLKKRSVHNAWPSHGGYGDWDNYAWYNYEHNVKKRSPHHRHWMDYDDYGGSRRDDSASWEDDRSSEEKRFRRETFLSEVISHPHIKDEVSVPHVTTAPPITTDIRHSNKTKIIRPLSLTTLRPPGTRQVLISKIDPCDLICTKFELEPVCATNGICIHEFPNQCLMDTYNCKHPKEKFKATRYERCQMYWLEKCQDGDLI